MAEKKVTRYTYEDILEPRSPETGDTSLLPSDEESVVVEMGNWSYLFAQQRDFYQALESGANNMAKLVEAVSGTAQPLG